jgi:hypothetical protein
VALLNRRFCPPNLRVTQTGKGFFPGLLLLLFLCICLLWPIPGATQAGEAGIPSLSDVKRIEGFWVRPDGGYILQLQAVKEDGSLIAAYFNPRPIKVFQADVRPKEGVISLFVELRDVNYPGSTYTLDYDPVSDRLQGVYFQAASGQSFQVAFERMK